VRTRRLGDIEVPAVGCGDVSLARAAARGIDAPEVERALGEALERGLALVDVAHDADSERLVGTVVRALGVRDRAVVATRIPIGWRWQPAAFHREVDACLRATRLEPLPIVQVVIDPDLTSGTEWAEIAETCAQRTTAGDVVRWGAMIERDPREPAPRGDAAASAARDLCAALTARSFVAVHVVFNACEREEAALVDAALAAGLAVLAARPLAGGALAGALGPGVRLAPGDDRRAWDRALLERIALGVARLTAHVQLEPPAARATDAARAQLERNPRLRDLPCRTVAELAQRFVIDRGAIALPRLHRREHLGDAIAAAAAQPLGFDPSVLDS
jgi:aryl-alcohol dehydrogenase-like predicted oxidoreductase